MSRLYHLRAIHHAQRAQVPGRVAHHDPNAPEQVIVVDVDWKNSLDSHWPVVTEEEERDENNSQEHRQPKVLLRGL